MAQSWHSAVDDDLSLVHEVSRIEVRSTYPELNDICEATFVSRDHDIRSALCILSYYANGGRDGDLIAAIAACYDAAFDGLHLHNRIDEEIKVRGVKRRKLFSKEPSTTKVIVAGDFMYLMGFRLAYARAPGVVPYLMYASSSISDGIFKMVDLEHDPDVTEEDCMELMRIKNAVEYQILMESAAKEAGADEETFKRMGECGTYIGMAIRIMHDIGDLFGHSEGEKPEMETIIMGTPTLPIYYAMQDTAHGGRIREVYSDKEASARDAVKTVALIKDTDSIAKCRELISGYVKKARGIIEGLPESVYRDALLGFTNELGQ
jgi:geranylgeranyl pyrophosphate synthase